MGQLQLIIRGINTNKKYRIKSYKFDQIVFKLEKNGEEY